jgi:GPH family glycoside/pentoside/hexuronide:cation symporter
VSTEVVKEAKLEEEPRQCTKKEKLGHAIGVLGHDSMYTLWSTWTTPFLTDILKLPAGFLAFLFGGARFFDAFTDISMGIIAVGPVSPVASPLRSSYGDLFSTLFL